MPISADVAVDDGTSVVTYKTDKGDNPVKVMWSGFVVRENGEPKIKMLTVVLPQEPPKVEANAEKK